MSVVMADAEIIPLPKRRIFRDYNDSALLEAIEGCRDFIEMSERTLRRLEKEAEYRGLTEQET